MKLVISAPAEIYRWESDQEESVAADDENDDDSEYLADEEIDAEDDTDEELDEYDEEEEDEEEDEEEEDEEEAEEVTDTAVLLSLSDILYDGEKFADHLFDEAGTEVLQGVGISGGTLCFEFSAEDERLWGYTDYDVPRELEDDELQALVDFTLNQWSDGIGYQFASEYAEETGYFIQLTPPDDEVDYYYEAE